MGKVLDWIARNRKWIGGFAFAMWGALQADGAWTNAHPRLNGYLVAVAAYVFASGVHNSDETHREEQGR